MSKANIMFRQYIAETFFDSLRPGNKRAELWDAFYAGWIAREDANDDDLLEFQKRPDKPQGGE